MKIIEILLNFQYLEILEGVANGFFIRNGLSGLLADLR